MPKTGRRLICPACGRNSGVNNAGKVSRHMPPDSRRFDRPCPGSGKPGEETQTIPSASTKLDPVIAALRDRREALGYLQRDVAALARCHVQQYGHIERGESSPQWLTLRGIFAALKLEVTLHSAGTANSSDAERAAVILRLETELARARSQLGGNAGWQAYTRLQEEYGEVCDRADRLHAQVEQQRVRAVAAEETVSEVRAQNRQLRTEVTRLTELRDRARAEAQQVGSAQAALQIELDRARAETRRALEALDALARQPVLTHHLIDKARAAIVGAAA